MSFAFDAKQGLILIRAEVSGPSQTAVLRLALDTGATRTVLGASAITTIGYDCGPAAKQTSLTTGSGVVTVALVEVARVNALGMQIAPMEILAHPLPPSAKIDGVLGLDFPRGKVLSVNFRTGQIDLS